MKPAPATWHAVAGLVPHEPPMLLVEDVCLTGAEEGWARAVVQPEWPCLSPDGEVLEPAFFELMAQTFAAVAGQKAAEAGADVHAPRAGFLVGLRRIVIYGRAAVGDELTMRARLSAGLGEFSVLECEVWRAEEKLADGQVKVFSPPEEMLEALSADNSGGLA